MPFFETTISIICRWTKLWVFCMKMIIILCGIFNVKYNVLGFPLTENCSLTMFFVFCFRLEYFTSTAVKVCVFFEPPAMLRCLPWWIKCRYTMERWSGHTSSKVQKLLRMVFIGVIVFKIYLLSFLFLHFRTRGLKYVIPPSNQWTKQMLQSSITFADRSRVVLFVITDTSRSLPELCMVYPHFHSSECCSVL